MQKTYKSWTLALSFLCLSHLSFGNDDPVKFHIQQSQYHTGQAMDHISNAYVARTKIKSTPNEKTSLNKKGLSQGDLDQHAATANIKAKNDRLEFEAEQHEKAADLHLKAAAKHEAAMTVHNRTPKPGFKKKPKLNLEKNEQATAEANQLSQQAKQQSREANASTIRNNDEK